ncbi:hypothetical protein [Comamonas badia]|uniref:hypothetical protein n=1 Tax=Comamonas badia TaxID=265291 RepID=UPI0012EC262C|nr:hypothetical protein [Comamonas badia]
MKINNLEKLPCFSVLIEIRQFQANLPTDCLQVAYNLPTDTMPTTPSRARLTAGRVDAFTCPPGKAQAFLWDTEAPALAVRVTPICARCC